MSEWQPIETAPKGEWVLTYTPSKYNGKKKMREPSTSRVLILMDRVEPEYFWTPPKRAIDLVGKHGSYWSYHRKGRPVDLAPTHWMPLPAPPVTD